MQPLSFRYSPTTSSSNLQQHLISIHNITNLVNTKLVERRTQNIFNSSESGTTNQKTVWARRTALWLCEDLLPFNLVNGSGFRKWMVRNKYINNESQIASNVTISQSALNDCYEIVKAAFKEKLSSAPSTITLVTDLWTSLGKQPFLTISIRFLDNNLNLINMGLSTEPLPHPHTGEAIAAAIKVNLDEANLSNKSIIAVGDNGRNIIRIGPHFNGNTYVPPLLPDCKQYMRCLGHRIHLVLNQDSTKHDNFKIVMNLIGKIKKIHGVLAYKSNELKDEYYRLQHQELVTVMSEIDNVCEELSVDEESSENGDEMFIDTVRAQYLECIGGFETHTRFEQLNVTRWKSAENMVNSFVKNFGNFFICVDVQKYIFFSIYRSN